VKVPSATKKLTISGAITPGTCTSGSIFPLFSLSVTPSGGTARELIYVCVHCDTLSISIYYEAGSFFSQAYSSGSTVGPISFFFSIDLSAKKCKFEYQTMSVSNVNDVDLWATQSLNFDETTTIKMCSNKDGTKTNECTISDLHLIYTYFEAGEYAAGLAAGTTPTLAAFYSLTDGPATSLKNTISSTDSGYFGDSASSPTAGTSPSWDSSVIFTRFIEFIFDSRMNLSPSPQQNSFSLFPCLHFYLEVQQLLKS
jgi:hypothetical protein